MGSWALTWLFPGFSSRRMLPGQGINGTEESLVGGHLGFLVEKEEEAAGQGQGDPGTGHLPLKTCCAGSPLPCVLPAPVPARGSAWGGSIAQRGSQHCFMAPLPPPRKGLTFVSVHDCYWTHALTVDVMNQVKVSSWLPCEQDLADLCSGPMPGLASPGLFSIG